MGLMISAMESVEGGGLRSVRCSPTLSEGWDEVQRTSSQKGSSAHQQVLLLLGTWSCANDKKNFGRKVGRQTTYSPVRATLQVAVPLHTQSVLAAVHSDQV
jgi:hypothetical protein